VSWAENYAGSSGLASPKLFNPLHFVRDTSNTAPVSDDIANSALVFSYCSTPCLKNSQNYFCHNFVKFPPIFIIFGTKMAKMTELCKVNFSCCDFQ